MESNWDFHALRAALEWQIDLGATEAIQDAPVNRFESTPKPAAKPAQAPNTQGQPTATEPAKPDQIDPVQLAQDAAAAATNLSELNAALAAFEHCDLKRGARNCVFSDGNPNADLMIIGEAPGRDEDLQGRPFVGRAGQLLDKMFAAIGRDRGADTAGQALYITNVLPWRPPQNRDPLPAEIAMMKPFVLRHIALAQPKLIVLMGNIACQAMLDKKGITRLRGTWTSIGDIPAMPMFHPAYLLRNPARKRDAWADLLDIQHTSENLT